MLAPYTLFLGDDAVPVVVEFIRVFRAFFRHVKRFVFRLQPFFRNRFRVEGTLVQRFPELVLVFGTSVFHRHAHYRNFLLRSCHLDEVVVVWWKSIRISWCLGKV